MIDIATTILESNKKELTLGLNSFNTPEELSGVRAWVQLIVNLMFIRKGQYPSNPKIGIGIQDYDYKFVDDAKAALQADLKYQTETFIPEVPIESIQVTSTTVERQNILVIIITLRYNNELVTTVVATAENSNHNIDFEIKI